MKTLLVTLGDSWTQGVGSYPAFILNKYGSIPIVVDEHDQSILFKYYDEHSWPRLLSNSIGCDLLNLGYGGASNSGMARQFYLHNLDTSKYSRVLVIQMLTDYSRVSFYSENYNLIDITVNDITSNTDSTFSSFYSSYVLDVMKNHNQLLKETAFYLKTVEAKCLSLNYEFYYCSAFFNVTDLLEFYKVDNLLHGSFTRYAEILSEDDFATCGHPNENGYEKISQEMAQQMKLKKII
jgi:lysophospholipase L1-like esterase